jgi:hypothetical protein
MAIWVCQYDTGSRTASQWEWRSPIDAVVERRFRARFPNFGAVIFTATALRLAIFTLEVVQNTLDIVQYLPYTSGYFNYIGS